MIHDTENLTSEEFRGCSMQTPVDSCAERHGSSAQADVDFLCRRAWLFRADSGWKWRKSEGELCVQQRWRIEKHVARIVWIIIVRIELIWTWSIKPLSANDADRHPRIRKRVSANDAYRRHRLACAIWVVFLYLRASERNVTLGALVAVVGPSHSNLIVSSGRTSGAQSTAALCAKFHAVLLDESSRPHLRARDVYKAARVNSDPTILWDDSRRLTFSFAPHTYVNFMPIFLDRPSCLHRCFRCIYTTANNKSYRKSSWITVLPEKILTEAVSAIRRTIKRNTQR